MGKWAVADQADRLSRTSDDLAAAGAQTIGVDASQEMLAVARSRAVGASRSVEFRVGDAHRLEFPDRSFDLVVSFRVLMHTPGWRTCAHSNDHSPSEPAGHGSSVRDRH